MAARSTDVALSAGLVLLSWGMLWALRASLSRQEFRFGFAALLVITAGFVLGRIVEWRSR